MTILSTYLESNQRRQFQDVFPNVLEVEVVWNPASVNSNSETHEDVTVPGARLGDFVLCSVDIDVQNLDVVAFVTAANTVTVGIHNPTAGAVDLGQLNLHLIVLQARHTH